MMMMHPLPSIIASAIQAAGSWPVEDQRLPMMYQPLEDLERQRCSSTTNTKPSHLPPSPLSVLEIFQDPNGSDGKQTNNPFVMVAVALLYLSHGYPDECHALVTPLSWHEATYFSGPPVAIESNDLNEVQDFQQAQAAATYAHMLLHRWEGSNVGELGMTGYSNAQYWGRATLARGTDSLQPVFARIRQLIQNDLLVLQSDATGPNTASHPMTLSDDAKAAGRIWLKEWIVSDFPDNLLGWEPRALTGLCQQIEKSTNNIGDANNNHKALAEFCAAACYIECDVLMEFCWEKAGYDVRRPVQPTEEIHDDQVSNSDTTTTIIDPDEAVRASKRVSSAHLDLFQQKGDIVVRSVGSSLSAAAGVACRLLQAPACRLLSSAVNHDAISKDIVYIYLAAEKPSDVIGTELSKGDVWVSRTPPRPSPMRSESKVRMLVLEGCSVDRRHGIEQEVLYIDRFHGTRGETPTTVIQWSKGTIF